MRSPTIRVLSLVLALFTLSSTSWGYALLNEPFTYDEGELVTVSAGAWSIAPIDSQNPDLDVIDGALQWDYTVADLPANAGYYGIPFSGTNLTLGPIYYHFDLTVETAPAIEAGLFAALWNGTTGLRARLWIGAGTEANTFRMGMTESSGSKSGVIWDSVNYAEGTTLRIVVKYDFVDGVDTDTTYLYIDATDEADIAVTVDEGGSVYPLNGFAVRNKGVDGNLGKFSMDNLAISMAFEDTELPTQEATPDKLVARAITGERILVNWKDGSTTETGFLLERSTVGGAFGTVATLDPNELYYVDSDVVVGTEYCYRVTALGEANSAASASSCATPIEDPVIETISSVQVETNAPALWLGIEAPRAITYSIEKSLDLLDWTPVVTDYRLIGIYDPIEFLESFSSDPGGEDTDPFEGIEGPTYVPDRFYRISGQVYPVPANIGLSEPFQMPNNGGGAVLNVTDYGATSDESSNDDAIAFRAALAAAQAGDTVLIPAGTYHVRSTVAVKSGIIVKGEGPDETTILSDTAILNNIFNVPSGAADVTIRDLAIDLESSFLPDGVLTYGVLISSSSGSVVNRVWVYNLQVEHFAERGIMARQAKHVKVENCRILNATKLGGGGEGYAITFNDSNNNNNWATGNVIGPVIRHGVLLQYETHNNLVENNTIYGTTEDAIDLHGEDEWGNEIRFNLCYWEAKEWDGTPVGIGLGNTGATHDDAGPYNWIHHNEVYGYYGGLEVILDSHAQYIDANYFHNNQMYGILLNNGGGDAISIRGNIIADNGSIGISVDSSNAVLIQENQINGNNIGITVTANSLGYDISHNDLSGNTSGLPILLGNTDGIYEDNIE